MKIEITEDQSLAMGIELEQLVLMNIKQGFREIHRYQHPAVGTVVVMEQDYSLAP
jgi:hypothetical protein